MKQAIFNRETLKIELHFDKAEYTALSDAEKAEIKSAFLWSNRGGCWVSRTKEPNLWRAKQIAQKLGFGEIEKVGERLTFAEQVDRAQEKANARAERYEEHAERAEKRAEVLQKPMNDHHGDIAFFTQPNINSSAGRSFTRYRERVYASFDKGIEEYRRSEYWKGRAETARQTAAGDKYKDPAYLERKIKECKLNMKHQKETLEAYENTIEKLTNGQTVKRYDGTEWTLEEAYERGTDLLERMEAERDKLAFFLDAFEALGGVKWTRENIKPGYTVKVARWGTAEVVSVGKVNCTIKLPRTGSVLTIQMTEIEQVIKEAEQQQAMQPFVVGEVFTVPVWTGKRFEDRDFRIIKATEKSVTLQNGDEKPIIRRPSESKFTKGEWILCINDSYRGIVRKKAAV